MARERAWKQPSSKAEDKTSEISVLLQMEDAWMAARLMGKSKIVDQMIDDEYSGGTSGGLPQTKQGFMKSVESSVGAFTHYVHSGREIKLRGDMAISTGIATLTSPKRLHSFRYLRVFSKSRGKWRVIASQSTPLPTS